MGINDARADISDAVVGEFARGDLSAALVATHRAGFGAHARVLDPTRGDLASQLARAGFRLALAPTRETSDTILILVTAPGRAAAVSQIFASAGAGSIHLLTRATPFDVPSPLESTTYSPPLPGDEPRPA